MRHVVMFSGGLGSWLTAKRAAAEHGPENVTLLFADVKGDSTSSHVGEDEDTYRFIIEAAADVLGVRLPPAIPVGSALGCGALPRSTVDRAPTPGSRGLDGAGDDHCGGFCVRAGQAQMELLMREHPERYLFHEAEEQKLRDYLDKDVSILRDRTGGTLTPLTLRRFRDRIEDQPDMFDALDVGGCGCFTEGGAA